MSAACGRARSDTIESGARRRPRWHIRGLTLKKIVTPILLFFAALAVLSFGADVSASGKEFTVEMTFKDDKMVYSPAKLSIHLGDKVAFVMVSGAPHTVIFYKDKVPGRTIEEKNRLAEQLSYKKNNGFLYEPGETYTVHFIDVPRGKYHFYCIPHQGMGMKGMIEVK